MYWVVGCLCARVCACACACACACVNLTRLTCNCIIKWKPLYCQLYVYESETVLMQIIDVDTEGVIQNQDMVFLNKLGLLFMQDKHMKHRNPCCHFSRKSKTSYNLRDRVHVNKCNILRGH